MSVLEVENLKVDIHRRESTVHPVDGVSFSLRAGETVGLVGESGCGKTITGRSLMGLLPPGGRIAQGTVRLDGRDLTGLDADQLSLVRGNDIAMIFQDPMTSLNPTLSVGVQVAEPVRIHKHLSKEAARRAAIDALGMVGMPRPAERFDDYPHQLSGGLRQRVMIAMALVCEPQFLIADEPTTALDVTIQAQILELLDRLKGQMGILLVTHDLGVIAARADRVMVMYAGRIVESSGTERLFAAPGHPYTEALLRSIPRLDQDRNSVLFAIPGRPPDLSDPPTGCRFAARCRYATEACREDPVLREEIPGRSWACFHPRHEVGAPRPEAAAARAGGVVTGASPERPLLEMVEVHKEFPVTAGVFRRTVGSVKAVSGVSLAVHAGETLGLVGESGCGKTTMGHLAVSMERPDQGKVLVDGVDTSTLARAALRRMRREVQLVFQDPYGSLNPRVRVGASLKEPMVIQRLGTRRDQDRKVLELLDAVGLPPSAVNRFPHEFSGGQRQRIGFARALTLDPRLIVADEPVSALDVSIQAQILNLMKDLQEQFGLTYVVISHDLSVVKYLADRVGVMYLGKLVELGPSGEIFQRPAHPYTAGLLEVIPEPDPGRERLKSGAEGIGGELPSALEPPSGCRFRTRCPRAEERCAAEEPVLRAFGQGHVAACHFPLEAPVELTAVATPLAPGAPT